MRHTPGPWETGTWKTDGSALPVVKKGRRHLAEGWGGQDEDYENIKLMAKSPEMYSMIDELLGCDGDLMLSVLDVLYCRWCGKNHSEAEAGDNCSEPNCVGNRARKLMSDIGE